MIKVATNKIWLNPTQRPNDFEGNIVVAEIKPLENNDEPNGATVKAVDLDDKSQEKTANVNNIERSQPAEESGTDNSLLEKVEYKSLEPLSQKPSTTLEDGLDLLAFLPSVYTDQGVNEDLTIDEAEDNLVELKNINSAIQPDAKFTTHNKSSLGEEKNDFIEQNKMGGEADQVTQFFEWLQGGITKGSLKTNQAKARIHTVDEGVILITPGIFQDFARTKEEENFNWTAIQQKVLKKNWHVRNDKGLNVVKYRVKGQNKQTTVNAVLFQDVSKVFGSKELSGSNPHLTKVD